MKKKNKLDSKFQNEIEIKNISYNYQESQKNIKQNFI